MVLPRRPTGFDARAVWRAALPILFACAAEAFAAHPLLTEDTGTQGAGRFELELGNTWPRDGGERADEFAPQLVEPAVDCPARRVSSMGPRPATLAFDAASRGNLSGARRSHLCNDLVATRCRTGHANRGLLDASQDVKALFLDVA